MFSKNALHLEFTQATEARGKDIFVVRATYDGSYYVMETPFHAPAGRSESELRELWIDAIGSDAYAVVENDEQGWLEELGYDTEDPVCWSIRNAVVEQTEELKRLLGDDFDSFVYQEYKQAQAPANA